MKDRRLRELGAELARAQDQGRADDPNRLDALRESILAAAEEAPEPRVRWPRLAIPAAGTALALAAVLVAWVAWPSAMTFQVGPDRAGVAGAWIAAPSGEALPLVFSDGTRVELDGGSRARVDDLDADGARVVLESGAADIQVVPRPRADWSVGAGPFEVRVTGTRFHLRWLPDEEVFVLALESGSVDVTGPVLGARQSLEAGQELRVSVAQETAVITSPGSRRSVAAAKTWVETPEPAAAPSPEAASESAKAPEASAVEDGPAEPAAESANKKNRATAARRPIPQTWQTLASRGDFTGALELAEKQGLSGLGARLPAAELLRLGEVARYAGQPSKARTLLETLRRRFAGSTQAATAAYYLGRIAFERDRDYAGAAQWFSTYGDERPRGPLATEALGRLIESEHRAGDHGAAREAARAYLRRFPKGPHGDLARRLARESP